MWICLIRFRKFFSLQLRVFPYILFDSIDVHHLLTQFLTDVVYHADFIQSIQFTVTSISLPNWTCNDPEYTEFDFSRFASLQYLVIGDNCFGSVKTFQINGLNQLRCIKIGKNSFTGEKNGDGNDSTKSFHILNCVELESIEIGEYSFSDFSGQFELKNLFSLRSIVIGSMKMYSSNFYYCSFVIRGRIEMTNTDRIDLPNLQSITLGCYSFSDSVTTVLESIQLCELWDH